MRIWNRAVALCPNRRVKFLKTFKNRIKKKKPQQLRYDLCMRTVKEGIGLRWIAFLNWKRSWNQNKDDNIY